MSVLVETIPFESLAGISVGNVQNDDAKTGVTVFYFPTPATAAEKIFGGGPASREISLLDVERNDVPINAIVFSGGSSFGLEASTGVQMCLEEHGIGYDTGCAIVPLICQSDIYDLCYGKPDIRPDKSMGYDACLCAMRESRPKSGNVGVGIGATIGKAKGMRQACKCGIGYAAAQIGELKVGVAVVVNAFGDVYHHGQKVAGMVNEDRSAFADAADALYENHPSNLFTGNTTLAAIFTNANFNKSELTKVINMASAGLARSIRPVFTMADGDTIYCTSVGIDKVTADINVVGSLAADLVEDAIFDAVDSSRVSDTEFLSNYLL